MTGLVNSLLSLAGMENAKLELHNSPFDISEEVDIAITEMETVANDKGQKIIKEIEPEIVIDSDREQIRKVISTLLENAVKYTPYHGEITVSLEKEKRHIYVP